MFELVLNTPLSSSLIMCTGGESILEDLFLQRFIILAITSRSYLF